MIRNNLHAPLRILLILGILISLFLLYEHFAPAASKFCTFGESFDCGIVNKSPYANLDGLSYLFTIDFGLPLPLLDISGLNWILDLLTTNAFLGFLMLLFLFFILSAYEKEKKFWFIEKEKTLIWMKGLTLFSLIYAIYLIFIQHFILKTYCLFCLILDLIILINLICIWRMKKLLLIE